MWFDLLVKSRIPFAVQPRTGIMAAANFRVLLSPAVCLWEAAVPGCLWEVAAVQWVLAQEFLLAVPLKWRCQWIQRSLQLCLSGGCSSVFEWRSAK